MYSVMLIDDEPIILEKLQYIIDWEKEDCRVVAVAGNGTEALKKCQDFKPQIIFSDIYMPLMDGIELAEEIKNILPESIVILISGYNEFTYAQKAIEAGVFRYLLKPIRASELINILSEAKTYLIEEQQKTEEKKRLHTLIKKNLPGLQEKFFAKLVEGELNSDDLEEHLSFLEIGVRGKLLGTIIFHLDNYLQLAKSKKEADIQFCKFHIIDLIKEKFSKDTTFLYSFANKPNEIVVIYGVDAKEQEEKLNENILTIQDHILNVHNISFSAGLGGLYPDLISQEISYREAKLALDFKVWTGKNALIPYKDIESSKSGQLLFYKDQETFSSILREGDLEKVTSFIENIFATIKSENYLVMPKSYLHLTILGFVNQIIRSILEFNGSIEEVYGTNFDPLIQINTFETLDDLKTWLLNLSYQAVEFIDKHKQKVGRNFVDKARTYLDNNFRNPELNLIKVAEHVYISPSYLSRLFKEVTNYTITEYLNKTRIKEAENLLINSSDKIYEIAERIGFRDSHYFGIVFKKITGLSPSEYRDKVRLNGFINS